MINNHIKNHPEDLIHAQMRYPKDDPRLAELNWKMDQMLKAGEEYMDSNFKENQTLYKRAMDRTKKNIKLTNPEYVQQHYDEQKLLSSTTLGFFTPHTHPIHHSNSREPTDLFSKRKRYRLVFFC